MKSREKRLLSLALLPLLAFSFTMPLSSSANSGGSSGSSSLLQFIESVYAVSGTVTRTVSTAYVTVTEQFTVNHHGNSANVQEVVTQANSGSQAFSQTFTITPKSTSKGPDYDIVVPGVHYSFDVNSTDPNGPNSPSPDSTVGLIFLTMGANDIPQTRPQFTAYNIYPQPSQCFGAWTWSLVAYAYPSGADWNGPYLFAEYCVFPAVFTGFSGYIYDTVLGITYPFSGSNSGSYLTNDLYWPTWFNLSDLGLRHRFEWLGRLRGAFPLFLVPNYRCAYGYQSGRPDPSDARVQSFHQHSEGGLGDAREAAKHVETHEYYQNREGGGRRADAEDCLQGTLVAPVEKESDEYQDR